MTRILSIFRIKQESGVHVNVVTDQGHLHRRCQHDHLQKQARAGGILVVWGSGWMTSGTLHQKNLVTMTAFKQRGIKKEPTDLKWVADHLRVRHEQGSESRNQLRPNLEKFPNFPDVSQLTGEPHGAVTLAHCTHAA